MVVVGTVQGHAHPRCHRAVLRSFGHFKTSLADQDIHSLWGSADLLEGSATETMTELELSAITITVCSFVCILAFNRMRVCGQGTPRGQGCSQSRCGTGIACVGLDANVQQYHVHTEKGLGKT